MITPPDRRPIGLILWENYTSLADSILEPQVREDEHEISDSKKKMRQVIVGSKMSLFLCLVQFFLKVAESGYVDEETAKRQEKFWETVMTKLDKHMRAI